MASRNRRYTVNEIISMLEDEGNFERADIHVQPPPVDELTDEDSASEDEEVGYNNLSGRQLDQQATATETDHSSDSSDTDEYEVPANIAKRLQVRIALWDPAPRPKRPAPVKRKWENLPEQDKDRFTWHGSNIDKSRWPQTPDGIFNLFFDDDVINMIIEQSIRYAGSKGNHSFSTSPQEIRIFLAILLISGYNTVPRRRQFWSRDDDVRNEAIARTMPQDRFDILVRYVHLCDNNNLDREDKFSKVRPLLCLLNERFLLYFLKEKNLSIDESMIPYYGRHGAKQFIRGKPIRFGYKINDSTWTMGGVDRMDQNVEKYRISIRSKKWWWPVFMYCIDLAVQQTWHIYRATDAGLRQPLDLLGVRRALVTVLLAQGRTPAVSPGRPR
ncbi:piggyBac transposable element-derived protein 3-like, partial [Ruditapes philippinarum]|uniref:piggyBac transposable element-derived protein 3-like n=1 Tax=Ruditapes philippinarum TaxID=129788 RepID=UPI00295B592C